MMQSILICWFGVNEQWSQTIRFAVLKKVFFYMITHRLIFQNTHKLCYGCSRGMCFPLPYILPTSPLLTIVCLPPPPPIKWELVEGKFCNNASLKHMGEICQKLNDGLYTSRISKLILWYSIMMGSIDTLATVIDKCRYFPLHENCEKILGNFEKILEENRKNLK